MRREKMPKISKLNRGVLCQKLATSATNLAEFSIVAEQGDFCSPSWGPMCWAVLSFSAIRFRPVLEIASPVASLPSSLPIQVPLPRNNLAW